MTQEAIKKIKEDVKNNHFILASGIFKYIPGLLDLLIIRYGKSKWGLEKIETGMSEIIKAVGGPNTKIVKVNNLENVKAY